MMKSLEKYSDKYMNPQDVSKLEFCDEAFIVSMEIQEEDKDFDAKEIREIFFEFFVSHFKSYEKYFGFKNKKNNEKLVFNKEMFLKDHFSTDVKLH